MRAATLWFILLVGCSGGTEPTTDTDAAPTDTGVTCQEAEQDCAGVCFGDSTLDDCGRCDDVPDNDCVQIAVANAGWTCPEGVTCQDIFDVGLRQGADVTVEIDAVTGSSLVRLAVFAPGSRPSEVNVLVGTHKDLACGGVDEGFVGTFRAPASGTWRVAVGRDGPGSSGTTGSYRMTIESDKGVDLADEPFQDDAATQSAGFRCGNEYRFPADWQCGADESCQDSFEVDLAAGTVLDLSVTELDNDSVAGLALYAPGNRSGDANLLTNSRHDRVCEAPDVALVAPPFEIPVTGTYTVTATRSAPDSVGDQGRYALVVGAEAFFDRPSPAANDVESRATGAQCDWTLRATGGWTCGTDESCQDVYDLDLPNGVEVVTQVTAITGTSAVLLAAFAPGEPLSGINRYTLGQDDLACWAPDADALPPPLTIQSAGTWRFSVGRDASTSTGTTGSYDVTIGVVDAYGSGGILTVDDEASLAQGTACP